VSSPLQVPEYWRPFGRRADHRRGELRLHSAIRGHQPSSFLPARTLSTRVSRAHMVEWPNSRNPSSLVRPCSSVNAVNVLPPGERRRPGSPA
jgi:hypothetical protein